MTVVKIVCEDGECVTRAAKGVKENVDVNVL